MGCCGCTLQTSAIVAVVFGFIQSIGGLTAAAVLINLLKPENLPKIEFQTSMGTLYISNYIAGYDTFKALCDAHIAFNVIWLISSIVLIIGISKEHAHMHRQWTFVTAGILVSDVILVIVAFTKINFSTYSADDSVIYVRMLALIAMLSRWGIVGLIINICLAIYVSQRATEILRGPMPVPHVIVYSGQPYGQPMQPGQTIMAAPGQTIMLNQPIGYPGAPPIPNVPPPYPPESKGVPPYDHTQKY